jgi:hypothetical protein
MTNETVVTAWKNGKEATSGNLSTNGLIIRSYDIIIGVTTNGVKIGIDHTTKGGSFHSVTTSTHVGLVKRVASKTFTVNEYDKVLANLVAVVIAKI